MSLQSELTTEQLTELQESKLFNADLAPVPSSGRKWRMGSFAALWISMSACIPTYMLASSLIGGGGDSRQAILTIFSCYMNVLLSLGFYTHAVCRYVSFFPVFYR